MFGKSRTLRIMFLGVLLVVIAAVIASFVYFSPIPTAQAAPPPFKPAAPADARNCIIAAVYVIPSLIVVNCTTPQPADVYWYAIHGDAAHAREANRYLVLLNTAWSLNQDVQLFYNADSTANPPGCLAADCRMLTGVWLIP